MFSTSNFEVCKGQLISKSPYEKSVSSKIPTKIFLKFCPEIFCSFLRASWKLFGLPGDLVSNIINEEGKWKPKKLPGSPQKATKKFRAEIQKYFRYYFGWNWFFIRTFWNQLTFNPLSTLPFATTTQVSSYNFRGKYSRRFWRRKLFNSEIQFANGRYARAEASLNII